MVFIMFSPLVADGTILGAGRTVGRWNGCGQAVRKLLWVFWLSADTPD
jgi:hypothetical protein